MAYENESHKPLFLLEKKDRNKSQLDGNKLLLK